MELMIQLTGGLGLFIAGINMMGDGIEEVIGKPLRNFVEKFTKNKILGLVFGFVFTALVQSSTAALDMVVSFVDSGLMTLGQAAGIILGANIGTTITAQITAFNLGAYAPMILCVGAVMYLFIKKNTVKHIGSIIMGFGMLFFGISLIKSAISPLSESATFISFLETLSNPAIAVVFGIAFTALLQSSSSSVVIFQAFAIQGLLDYEMTVYLIIGAAIGSVTPNILASLTTNRNGKRTAVLNLLFNVIRAFIVILLINLFPQILVFIQNLTPGNIGRQVANTHTIFAILAVLIELPFANQIVALSEKIIPIDSAESRKREERKLHYMVANDRIPASVQLNQTRLELARMGHIAVESVENSMKVFFDMDDKLAESVLESEDTVDYLTDLITNELIKMRSSSYTAHDSYVMSKLLLVASDLERMSDHAENIVEYAIKMRDKKAHISEEGQAQLRRLNEATLASMKYSLNLFETEQFSGIPEAERLEQVVDDIHQEITDWHITCLIDDQVDPVSDVIFDDILTDLERCSDHAINVATALYDTNNKDSFSSLF